MNSKDNNPKNDKRSKKEVNLTENEKKKKTPIKIKIREALEKRSNKSKE